MIDDNAPHERDRKLTPREIRGWAEFCCWTTLALAPLLYWVNGPAVSTDQFVTRTALIVIAAITAITLRLFAWIKGPVRARHVRRGDV
jgi:hypothetical protein